MATLEYYATDRKRICKLCCEWIEKGERAIRMRRVRVSPKIVDLHFHINCLDKAYMVLKGRIGKEKVINCKKCGGFACICEDEGKWAAHCMGCDNSIGGYGVYDPCACSREEAIRKWNQLNAI